ncbi:hypothetical protein D3C80_1349240 [compost metagenome]
MLALEEQQIAGGVQHQPIPLARGKGGEPLGRPAPCLGRQQGGALQQPLEAGQLPEPGQGLGGRQAGEPVAKTFPIVHDAPLLQGLGQHESPGRSGEELFPHHGRDGGIAAGEHLGEAEDDVVAIDLQHGVGGKAPRLDVPEDGVILPEQAAGKGALKGSKLRHGRAPRMFAAPRSGSRWQVAPPPAAQAAGVSPDPTRSGWGWRAAGTAADRAPTLGAPPGCCGCRYRGAPVATPCR